MKEEMKDSQSASPRDATPAETSMIERVARALFEHQQFDPDMLFEDFKDEYLGEARVAIAAMREPMQSGEANPPPQGSAP